MIRQITNSLYDQFIADFELRSILSSSSESRELYSLRQTAFEKFRQLGFPSTKVEDWKYINLAPFLKDNFITEPEDDLAMPARETVSRGAIQKLDCYRIVLVNGQYQAAMSDSIPGEGVFVSPLSAAMNRPAFSSHFGKYINLDNHFAALNTALFQRGFIY
jgi:Fe-S cluster assembly protein SufD